MLDSQQTLALIKRAQAGDQGAKELLTEQNSPLVKSVIRRFVGKGVEYDDLYQLGCMGLVKAINNFDCTFNVKFSTYVVPMIIGEIKRFMRDDGSIKVSRSIKSQNMKIKRFVTQFCEREGKNPTIEDIANNFDMDAEEVVFVMDSARMPVSLYTPIEGDGGSKNMYFIDRLIQVDDNDKLFTSLALKQALSELEMRDKQIILMRFFRDKTQSEIAKD